jgi:hypothetical protein
LLTANTQNDSMTDTIISLTTIPPRFNEIGQTLESLLAQTADIKAIQIWIPKTYRREEFNGYTLPTMPKGVEIMQCEMDYGPATKILPAARQYSGEDINIIYCDDDEYYDSGFAKLLIDTSLEKPNQCIAICGKNVESVDYEAHVNAWTFKLYSVLTLEFYRKFYKKKYRVIRPGAGPVDIAQGFGGVLVRPEYFGETAFEIPDILWTVDDIWLSGQMCKKGVSIYRASDKKMCNQTSSASIDDLTTLNYKGFDRFSADLRCVNYFRKHHGIWDKR